MKSVSYTIWHEPKNSLWKDGRIHDSGVKKLMQTVDVIIWFECVYNIGSQIVDCYGGFKP